MVLFKIATDNVCDVSKIFQFAQENRKILEDLAVSQSCYSEEEICQISKFQDFFKHVECVATYTLDGVKRDEAGKLDEELLKIIKDATKKRDNTDSPLLYCLYDDIENQRDQLVQIVRFLRSKIIQPSDGVGRETLSCLSSPRDVNTNSLNAGSRRNDETPEKATALQNIGLDNVPNPKTDQYPKVDKRNEYPSSSQREGSVITDAVDDLPSSARMQSSIASGDRSTCSERIAGGGHKLNSSQASAIEDTNTVTYPGEFVTRGSNDVTEKSAEKSTTKDIKIKDLTEEDKVEIQRILQELETKDQLRTQENTDRMRSRSVARDAPCRKLPTGSGPMVKSAFRGTRNIGANGTEDIRTLEDSLKAFDLLPRLSELDESLEKVRRRKRTPEEHEAECKRFDKELQNLSLRHHPDRVMSRGGTDEEVARAKLLQSAINATRTVLSTINKMFLEDIDIDHKYVFFGKIDISVLANENEVESHVFDILFKISLVSDIKQENIVAEIRKFLEASRLCVESFLQNDVPNFENHRESVFYHLERCATGYKNLHGELKQVETECEKENLHNIYPVIKKMRRDCREQMQHLEALHELSKFPFGKHPEMYRSHEPMDDYFVLPLACYMNVILACGIMIKEPAGKKASSSWFPWKKVKAVSEIREIPDSGMDFEEGDDISSLPTGKEASNSWFSVWPCKNVGSAAPEISQIPDFGMDFEEGDDISSLHQMASFYAGNILCKTSAREQFGYVYSHRDKGTIKMKFRETLMVVRDFLGSRFQIKDYTENGTKKQIMKELKLCRQMMAEFEKKTREVASCIEEIGKSNDRMNTGMEEILREQGTIRNELSEFLANTEIVKKQIENYSQKKKYMM